MRAVVLTAIVLRALCADTRLDSQTEDAGVHSMWDTQEMWEECTQPEPQKQLIHFGGADREFHVRMPQRQCEDMASLFPALFVLHGAGSNW